MSVFYYILLAFIGFAIAAFSSAGSKQYHPIFIILLGPLMLFVFVGIAAQGYPSGLVLHRRWHFLKYGVLLIIASFLLSIYLGTISIGIIGALFFVGLFYYKPYSD